MSEREKFEGLARMCAANDGWMKAGDLAAMLGDVCNWIAAEESRREAERQRQNVVQVSVGPPIVQGGNRAADAKGSWAQVFGSRFVNPMPSRAADHGDPAFDPKATDALR
jgi:hypothetical protein